MNPFLLLISLTFRNRLNVEFITINILLSNFISVFHFYRLYLQTDMRILACILSFYIIALTAIPCIDLPEDHDVQTIEMTQNTGDHQHPKDIDHCSPFCTCNCCASPIIQHDLSIQFDSFSFLQQYISTKYSSEFVSRYSGSIWQPPQLS